MLSNPTQDYRPGLHSTVPAGLSPGSHAGSIASQRRKYIVLATALIVAEALLTNPGIDLIECVIVPGKLSVVPTGLFGLSTNPGLSSWATLSRPCGTES